MYFLSRFLCIVLFSIPLLSRAQDNGWFKLYSGTGYDRGEGILQLESDSSYFITGSSSSWGENQSAYLLHIDQDGNYIWSRSIGGPEMDFGKRILFKNNFLYVLGMSNSYSSNPDLDIFVVKLTLDGNILWEKTYPMEGWQFVNDAAWKTDTSFVLVGHSTQNPNGIDPGFYFELNTDGDSLHYKDWGMAGSSSGHCVQVFGDSCLVYSGDIYNPDQDRANGLIVCEDFNGTQIWSDTLDELLATSCILDFDYGVNILHAVGYRSENPQDEDEIFINYNFSNGIILNQSIAINDQSSKRIEEVVAFVDANGGQKIAIGMENYTFSTPDRLEDILIANFDANGLYWLNESRTIEFEDKDEIGQLILTLDSSYIVVGTNKTQGLSDFTFNGGQHIFVYKPGKAINFPLTDNNAVLSNLNTLVSVPGIDEDKGIQVYPNPFLSEITIVLDQSCLVRIHDTAGALIFEQNATMGKNILCLESMQKGTYFMEIEGCIKRIIKL